MNYQVVLLNEGQYENIAVEGNVEDFAIAMQERGFNFVGFENRNYLRNELLGQPRFEGLAGPMFNGENCIRYENYDCYNEMSV